MPSSKQGGEGRAVNTDKDRHAKLTDVFSRINDEIDLPEGCVERLEVQCQASGEVVYRYWAPKAEEPSGGYLAPS